MDQNMTTTGNQEYHPIWWLAHLIAKLCHSAFCTFSLERKCIHRPWYLYGSTACQCHGADLDQCFSPPASKSLSSAKDILMTSLLSVHMDRRYLRSSTRILISFTPPPPARPGMRSLRLQGRMQPSRHLCLASPHTTSLTGPALHSPRGFFPG